MTMEEALSWLLPHPKRTAVCSNNHTLLAHTAQVKPNPLNSQLNGYASDIIGYRYRAHEQHTGVNRGTQTINTLLHRLCAEAQHTASQPASQQKNRSVVTCTQLHRAHRQTTCSNPPASPTSTHSSNTAPGSTFLPEQSVVPANAHQPAGHTHAHSRRPTNSNLPDYNSTTIQQPLQRPLRRNKNSEQNTLESTSNTTHTT